MTSIVSNNQQELSLSLQKEISRYLELSSGNPSKLVEYINNNAQKFKTHDDMKTVSQKKEQNPLSSSSSSTTTVLKTVTQSSLTDFSEVAKTFWKLLDIGRALTTTLNNVLKTRNSSAIYGSLTRFPWEILRDLANNATPAKVPNDIDIVAFSRMPTKCMMKSLIKYCESVKIFTANAPLKLYNDWYIQSVSDSKNFYSWRNSLSSLRELMTGVKKWELTVVRLNEDKSQILETVFIDLISHKPTKELALDKNWSTCDFDVNLLTISNAGYGLSFGYENASFFEVIEHIRRKETVCKIPFARILAMAQAQSLFQEKAKFLKLFVVYITQRWAKIHKNGYSTLHSPMLSIEKEEECTLTGIKAPYVNIQLQCTHKVSLNYFSSYLDNGNLEHSEAMRCPFCRANFVPKLNGNHAREDFAEAIFMMNVRNNPLDNQLTSVKENRRSYLNSSLVEVIGTETIQSLKLLSSKELSQFEERKE